jgi:hypothetical protein
LLAANSSSNEETAMAALLYGPVINDALASPRTKLQDLKVLRDHAAAVLKSQGNLKTAIARLDKEIRRREKQVGKT